MGVFGSMGTSIVTSAQPSVRALCQFGEIESAAADAIHLERDQCVSPAGIKHFQGLAQPRTLVRSLAAGLPLVRDHVDQDPAAVFYLSRDCLALVLEASPGLSLRGGRHADVADRPGHFRSGWLPRPVHVVPLMPA